MVLAEMLPATAPAEPLPPRPWNPSGTDSFEALLAREGAAGEGAPRLIVSHAPVSLLPASLVPGGTGKLVVVARDPKDVVTSNFFFMGTPADGWDGSMNRFLAPADETPNAFGGWFEHVASAEQRVAELGPERGCLVEYEDMHMDMPAVLTRLAQTLGPEAESRLAEGMSSICEALGFEVMKGSEHHGKFLRKGQPGNWREHFQGDDEARMAEALEARLPHGSSLGRASWRSTTPTDSS